MFCRKCGKELKEGAVFCANCGNPVQKMESAALAVQAKPAPVVQKAPAPAGTKKGKGGVAAVIIVAVLVVAAIGGGVWFFNREPEEPEPPIFTAGRDSENMDEGTDAAGDTSGEKDGIDGAESASAAKDAMDNTSGEKDSIDEAETASATEDAMDTEAPAEPSVSVKSDYILPESNSRYLAMEDLEGLTKEECRIARNELFARHGRIFTDEELQAYFSSCDWYQGTIQPDDFDDSVFNEYELANRDLIILYEQQQGYR